MKRTRTSKYTQIFTNNQKKLTGGIDAVGQEKKVQQSLIEFRENMKKKPNRFILLCFVLIGTSHS